MKILYVTTVSNTVNAFLIPHIKMLVAQGSQVDVAFNIVQKVKPEIEELGCKIHILPLKRSPFNKNNLIAYKELKKILQIEKYDLVHTHTPVASAIVRLACRKSSEIKVIYTPHGFHFFKGAPLRNWLIYYPVEKYLSRYTDVLITINKEDYNRAKKFRAKKVEYIPGVGLDTKKFENIIVSKKEKRKELGIPDEAIVLLSVGELNKNKNHETVIKAISKLDNKNLIYLICGIGSMGNHLTKMARKLCLEKQVILLGYRNDIPELLKMADIFVFPSKREGLGLAALEAMASGLPLITSNVHGIIDYSIDGITGFTCKPMDVRGFANAIQRLLDDKELRNKMGAHNKKSVYQFDLKKVLTLMEEIYANML